MCPLLVAANTVARSTALYLWAHLPLAVARQHRCWFDLAIGLAAKSDQVARQTVTRGLDTTSSLGNRR